MGVGGCVAQQEGERLITKAPYVDLVFGTNNIHRLPELIEKVRATGKAQVAVQFQDGFASFGGLTASLVSSNRPW